jgi:mannose-6-phosphate isomerase-like protein (cupin superfamily)
MDNPHTTASGGVLVDLEALSSAAQGNGPQWGHASDDLNLTLLSWGAQGYIAPHVNNEVDVVLVGIEGSGRVLVNGTVHSLQPGRALLIPKGAERAIESVGERFSYLSVHRRRAGLMPTLGGKPLSS